MREQQNNSWDFCALPLKLNERNERKRRKKVIVVYIMMDEKEERNEGKRSE